MSSTERSHFGALVRNMLADTQIAEYYEDLAPAW
jgi:hypothetical protein